MFLKLLEFSDKLLSRGVDPLKNNPHDAEAFFKRGLAKAVTGDSKGMLADVEKALEMNPAFAKRIEVMQGMIDKNF